jgi:hypothetical protein
MVAHPQLSGSLTYHVDKVYIVAIVSKIMAAMNRENQECRHETPFKVWVDASSGRAAMEEATR